MSLPVALLSGSLGSVRLSDGLANISQTCTGFSLHLGLYSSPPVLDAFSLYALLDDLLRHQPFLAHFRCAALRSRFFARGCASSGHHSPVHRMLDGRDGCSGFRRFLLAHENKQVFLCVDCGEHRACRYLALDASSPLRSLE
jgi:hypothetical protein